MVPLQPQWSKAQKVAVDRSTVIGRAERGLTTLIGPGS